MLPAAPQIVPFLAAFAQTTKQQLASQAALALNATAGLLQGDFAPAAAFAQATEMIIAMQASPVPTVLTIRRGGRACSRKQRLACACLLTGCDTRRAVLTSSSARNCKSMAATVRGTRMRRGRTRDGC